MTSCQKTFFPVSVFQLMLLVRQSFDPTYKSQQPRLLNTFTNMTPKLSIIGYYQSCEAPLDLRSKKPFLFY